MPHDWFPQPGDLMWTPADWAWTGGLLDVLLPALHYGIPVVARPSQKFDPEAALRLMARHARSQRLYSADGAAHDAGGARPARTTRVTCAR